MKKTTRAGLGIILIGTAIILPELSILGVDLSAVDPYILLIPQVGLMLIAIGWVMTDE